MPKILFISTEITANFGHYLKEIPTRVWNLFFAKTTKFNFATVKTFFFDNSHYNAHYQNETTKPSKKNWRDKILWLKLEN